MFISIVVPCYNEAGNIPKLLEKFDGLHCNDGNMELILVDNGSTDNTSDVIASVLPNYSFAKVVVIKKNEGYGNGIWKGVEAAEGDYIGWMHADMQTSPAEFDSLITILKQKSYPTNILIKGLRKKRPLSDTLFTLGMGLFESIYLKQWLYDINSQPTLFSRQMLTICENPPKDFSLDLYVYYRAVSSGFMVERHPVVQKKRESGTSSWNTGMAARVKLIKRVFAYSSILKRSC